MQQSKARDPRPPCRVVAHPDHKRMALFVESDQFSCLRLDLDTLDPTLYSKGRKWYQQEGKRQQERTRDTSQKASWNEAGK